MGNFRKLNVWCEAHALALDIYRTTRAFPSEERYGLTTQMRRSAASIPANIAEGCGRNADRELSRFVRIGLGSANELVYHLLLAHDIGLLDAQTFDVLTRQTFRVQAMLATLERTLKRTTAKPIPNGSQPIADS
jgi:four helix bundle protein